MHAATYWAKRKKTEGKFVKNGIYWNKRMSRGKESPGKMNEHFESAAHQSAVTDMAVYSKLEHGIENMLVEKNKAWEKQEEKKLIENRWGIKVLIDILNIVIVDHFTQYDPQFSNWLRERTMKWNNFNYLSGGWQNQFIDVLGV